MSQKLIKSHIHQYKDMDHLPLYRWSNGGRRLAQVKVSSESTGKAEVSKMGLGKTMHVELSRCLPYPRQHLRVGIIITKHDTDASRPRACY